MAKIRDIQASADHGRVLVDEQLQDLEARLTDLYARTSREAKKDLDAFLGKFAENDKEKRAQVASGEITQEEYIDWRNRTIFRTEAMTAKVNDLTQQMLHADQTAMAMVNEQLPEVYATSWNFAGYRGETFAEAAGFDYTQFTIVNADAVRILATKDPDLIPWKPKVDIPNDELWNRQHLQSAIMTGIVKGDSIPNIADRLMPVVNMDRTAAVRTARTAVTGVENKGRKDATERVKEAGIPMVEAWSCTHDARTRDTHILMDGTLPNEAGFYGEGIVEGRLLEYPADPNGEPSEVYNCRCAIVSTIKGIDHSKDDELYAKMMESEYYEDWLDVKAKSEEKEAQFQARREAAMEKRGEKEAAFEAEKPEMPKEPRYKTATTTKEAIELLHELGFDSVSSGVKKIDEQLFIQQVNQLSRLNATFGAIRPGMEFKTSKMSGTIASVKHAGDGLLLDLKLSTESFGQGAEYFISEALKHRDSGWLISIPDSFAPIATITHEYGHMVEAVIRFPEEFREKVREYEHRAAEALKRMSSFTTRLNDPVANAEAIKARNEARSIMVERDAYIKEHEVAMPKQHKAEIIEIAMEINPDLVVTDEMSRYGMSKPSEFFAEAFCNAMSGEPNDIGLAMLEWLRRQGYDI